MKRRLQFCSVGLAVLCLPANAVEAERISSFIQTVASLGCVIDENNQAKVLTRLGLTPAEGTEIVTILMSDGRAVPQGDDLRLTTGECS